MIVDAGPLRFLPGLSSSATVESPPAAPSREGSRMRGTPRHRSGACTKDCGGGSGADSALDRDWCIVIARSPVDGQLVLQIESSRSPNALAAIDGTDVHNLDGLMHRLSAAASKGPARGKS